LAGLVYGESDYYIAAKSFRGTRKHAIFDKDKNQITDWHDDVSPLGLVEGSSPYYVTTEKKKEESLIYIHKLGSKKVLGPFKYITLIDDEEGSSLGFIDDPFENEILVIMLDGTEKWITKEEADEFFDKEEYKEV
jgi:hypothetical protein